MRLIEGEIGEFVGRGICYRDRRVRRSRYLQKLQNREDSSFSYFAYDVLPSPTIHFRGEMWKLKALGLLFAPFFADNFWRNSFAPLREKF